MNTEKTIWLCFMAFAAIACWLFSLAFAYIFYTSLIAKSQTYPFYP